MRLPPLLLLLTLPAMLTAQEDPDRPVARTAALDADATAARMKLPPGFRMEVIAAEPDVVQPIAYTIDDRGRLWVLECTNYPESPGQAKDKVLAFEDADGDGKFEKRTVFWDKANFSSGIAVGFGGVWIGSPPNLLFIPDKDGDAVPDGGPQVVLDGWGAEDTHETLNNFTWGPDGWLYGTQGIFTNSLVGKPGEPASERVSINAGVWRYHPQRKTFERWCEGVSNQWGLDWNDHGEAFFAACVVPHMWHAVEGAHYTRQAGSHFNPYVYEDIRTIAWGRYEKAGYCGAMIYLGDAFPAEWRDNFFFHDVHMNRLRCETLTRKGSGFRSSRKTDFIHSPDPWFRGLSPQYGPDGGVFISDWYDKVPCHQQRAFTDRSNGRLYKIVNDRVKPKTVDLGKASDAELVEMQLHKNDWYVRHGRRLLQERGAKPETTVALEKILFENADDTRQLRALWALHGMSALSEASALRAMSAESEWVRGWAVTCACERGTPASAVLSRMAEMAAKDPSPSVRLRISSAVQKLPLAERWPLLGGLAGHADDDQDHNLPLMNWYAAEPAVATDPLKAVELVKSTRQGALLEYVPRRIVAVAVEDEGKAAPAMDALAALLSEADSAVRANILRGMIEGSKGRKRLKEPAAWAATYKKLIADADDNVLRPARELALLFGSSVALEQLRAVLANGKAMPEARREALAALLVQRDAAVLEPLLKLAAETGPIRIDALKALSNYDDPRISAALVAGYGKFSPAEKSAALTTLASRPSGITAMLTAIDGNKIPRKDLTPQLARLIQGAENADFDRWLARNFGALQPTSAERQEEIRRYEKFTGEEAILRADAKNGQAIFERTCAACHVIFGAGGKIGPELPGNFKDTGYLLQNILDPDAVIGRDYQQTFITTKDGKLLAGVVAAEDAATVTLKTLAEPVTVAKGDIAKHELSPQSMMPAGLLSGLQEPEVRDLFLYLRQSKNP